MPKSAALFSVFFLLVWQAYSQSLPYVHHLEIGPMIGKVNEDDKRVNFSFQSFHGVKPLPNHEIGFMVGVDTYPGFSLMPFALGWRGILDKGKRTSLYASLDIGYGSAWMTKRTVQNREESWYQGGSLISPAIGIRKKSKNERHAYSWSIGFKRQRASFHQGTRSQGLTSENPGHGLPPGFQSVQRENYLFQSLYLKWGIAF